MALSAFRKLFPASTVLSKMQPTRVVLDRFRQTVCISCEFGHFPSNRVLPPVYFEAVVGVGQTICLSPLLFREPSQSNQRILVETDHGRKSLTARMDDPEVPEGSVASAAAGGSGARSYGSSESKTPGSARNAQERETSAGLRSQNAQNLSYTLKVNGVKVWSGLKH